MKLGVKQAESLLHDLAEYCYAAINQISRSEVNMEDVLQEAKSQIAAELNAASTQITNDPLPTIRGDFYALTAVFAALLANSCKFRDTAAPRIHVSAVRKENEWQFAIKDNGLGFDPVYSERIFRPFERLYGKKYPGSGLGLALAKKVLAQHDGRIWAESQ